jgi:UDP-2,3-diacylglucosamine hydrolase
MWMFNYFEKELGIPIHRAPIEREINGRSFLIGHGDGLGPGDYGYKFIKKVFANKWCQWAFSFLHPNLGIGMAHFWSRKSRDSNREANEFLGPEKEWLVQYCEKKINQKPYDYLVFGHRHLPIDFTLSNDKSRYINLGEWMNFNSYAEFDGKDIKLRFFDNPDGRSFP